MEKPVKRRKTFDLRLTKYELLHLRDLFSIVLPPDVKKTLSQALAELEDRPNVEAMLWDKIVDACKEADLPIEDESPDYIVAPTGPPPLGVFQLASDPDGEEEESEPEADKKDDEGED